MDVPMSIITVASSKGGAGKTTIAELIVGTVASKGHRVAVIDADFNHTLASWIRTFDYPIDVHTELDEEAIFKLAPELDEGYDLVLIDTAGAAARATLYSIAQSDLVIVPVKLSGQDVTEAIKTVQLASKASQITQKDTQARVLMNEYKPRTIVAQHIEQQLLDLELPVMRAKLENLVAFKEMSLNGQVPSRWTAGIQVRGFIQELVELDMLPFLERSWIKSVLKRKAS